MLSLLGSKPKRNAHKPLIAAFIVGGVLTATPAAAQTPVDPAATAAITGASGPIAEEVAKRFPRILPAIKSSIQKRQQRKQSVIEKIVIEPMRNNSIMVFATVRCGIHRDNKTGRMRYRRLNVWVNNRLLKDNVYHPHAGAQRAMTAEALVKDAIDVEYLANAIEANAKKMPFVVRVEALCETYDERNGRFTGKKKHKKTREIFGEIKLDLVKNECWKYLESCAKAIAAAKVDGNSVEIVSFKSARRRNVGGCPMDVPFVAKVRASAAVSGRAWLAYEDGSRSRDHAWRLSRDQTASSKLSRRIQGKPGARKDGWARLVVSWKGTDGKTHKRQSGKVSFRARCNRQAGGGGDLKLQ